MLPHPVDEIRCSKSEDLKGFNVALCVTGSVASYRALDLARELIRRGASVRFVATPASLRFVTPTMMYWASGQKPIVKGTGRTEHIAIASGSGWAHAVVVAPATANTICKLANGISDNVVMDVLVTALGSKKPIVVAPAMHSDMYFSPVVKEGLERLRKMGVVVVDPDFDEGRLRMASVEEIADVVEDSLNPVVGLRGLKVLVTAGPTREHLDPVRFLSNASSGKMGYAIASVCANNGAETFLVSGPTNLKPPKGVRFKGVTSTRDMLDACLDVVDREGPQIIVLAAAPSDFYFEESYSDKVSSDTTLRVTLKPTPKISKALRERAPRAVLVGFKAEHGIPLEEHVKRARARMEEHGFDIIVANDVSRRDIGFGSDFNEGVIITRVRTFATGRLTKRALARVLLREAVEALKLKRASG
ncbi:MAG: bifunctional phosphopantothenoylcysteine decarboxylase/phosphopantothenate--cysteine ligase CoaBC [Candidatus Verstraetearchaeota archaeon]|nr:bifunctional phosphopantothenoylcysteine decarboxylase/phosphopantothenate--cysteine ligase CoaBC [Candidatus Verstraetearchaeota archaeon]